MSLPKIAINPFLLIKDTDSNKIKNELQKAIREERRAVLLVKSMPKDADLQSWLSDDMFFLVQNNVLSEAELSTLANKAKGQAIFMDFTHNRIVSFLQKGNSVLIHQENEEMTAEKIRSVCTMNKPSGAKVIIAPQGYSLQKLKNILLDDVNIVFSNYGFDFPEPKKLLIQRLIDMAKEKVWINASDLSSIQLKDFLKRGARIVFMADCDLSSSGITKLYNQASNAEKKRIKILAVNGPVHRRNKLKDTLTGIGSVHLDADDFFFN